MINMPRCHKIYLDDDVCYVRFGKQRSKTKASLEIFVQTIRDEQIICDYDKDGKIIGFELLGKKKPCQK